MGLKDNQPDNGNRGKRDHIRYNVPFSAKVISVVMKATAIGVRKELIRNCFADSKDTRYGWIPLWESMN